MPQNQLDSDNRHTRYELKALIETSRLLIESRDTDFVTSNLLLIVMGKLLVTKAAVLRTEQEPGLYKVEKVKGSLKLKSGDQITLPLSEEELNKASLDLTSRQKKPEFCQENGFCTLFNLRAGDNHLGYLCLGSRAGDKKWLDREKEFIESLATISAVAIANSEMVGELKKVNRNLDRRINELHTLFDLSKEFSTIIDRKRITNIFKFTMLGQLMIKKFFLIFDHEGSREMISSSGLKGELHNSQIDHLFQFREDVVSLSEIDYEQNRFLKENEIEKLVALRQQNNKKAVIGVGARANKVGYTEPDINFLISLGNLALLSIQKTFFLEEQLEKERMEEELNIAKTIQQGLLPNPIPKLKGIELDAINIPTHQIGGDYFDIEETQQGNYLMAIADVTGKGVPAALLMSNLQAMLQALAPLDIELCEATDRLNDNLYKNTPPDKFITFFWGSYNPFNKVLTYVNAGHNHPFLIRNNGQTIQKLEMGGLLLGAMPTTTAYEQGKIDIQTGDLMVAFTDGVTEAINPEGREFGEKQLLDLVKQHLDKTVSDLMSIICNRLESYSQGQQFDDITLLIARFD